MIAHNMSSVISYLEAAAWAARPRLQKIVSVLLNRALMKPAELVVQNQQHTHNRPCSLGWRILGSENPQTCSRLLPLGNPGGKPEVGHHSTHLCFYSFHPNFCFPPTSEWYRDYWSLRFRASRWYQWVCSPFSELGREPSHPTETSKPRQIKTLVGD